MLKKYYLTGGSFIGTIIITSANYFLWYNNFKTIAWEGRNITALIVGITITYLSYSIYKKEQNNKYLIMMLTGITITILHVLQLVIGTCN